jgi:hypothetical protein
MKTNFKETAAGPAMANLIALKVFESVRFFLGGKKCQEIVNIRVMRKDRAAQQRLFSGTILRGYNATSQCIWIQIFLFVIVIVLPICSTC